jgi:hypothetical protein
MLEQIFINLDFVVVLVSCKTLETVILLFDLIYASYIFSWK